MERQTQDQMLLCSNELFVGVSFLVCWTGATFGNMQLRSDLLSQFAACTENVIRFDLLLND
jgi:hypothetical protein